MNTEQKKEQDELARLHLEKLVIADLALTGLTKDAWARRVGVPGGSGQLTQHLNGMRRIQIGAAIKYAAYFKQPIDRFLGAQLDDVRNAAPLLSERSSQSSAVMEHPGRYANSALAALCEKISRLSLDGQAEIARQVDRELQIDGVRRRAAKKIGADH